MAASEKYGGGGMRKEEEKTVCVRTREESKFTVTLIFYKHMACLTDATQIPRGSARRVCTAGQSMASPMLHKRDEVAQEVARKSSLCRARA